MTVTVSTTTALQLADLFNRWFTTATEGITDPAAAVVKDQIAVKMRGVAVDARDDADTFYATMRTSLVRAMRTVNAMPGPYDEDLDRVNALLDVYSAVFHNQLLDDEVLESLRVEFA